MPFLKVKWKFIWQKIFVNMGICVMARCKNKMGEQNKMVMEIARKLKYNNVNG